MANYAISEKTQRIIVNGKLTEIEQQIVSMYIGQGYKVAEKSGKRVTEKDIIKYLEKEKDAATLEAFNKEKEKKITDKNGKERKAGYLVALKWFRINHAEAYQKIKEAKIK